MKKSLIFLALVLPFKLTFVFCQSYKNVDSIFKEIKRLNYIKASSLADEIDSLWLATSMNNIIGFNSEPNYKLEAIKPPKSNLNNEQFVYQILKGYNKLSTGKNENNEAFNNFLAALEIAQTIENIDLKKFALITVLDQLKSQIYIGSNQYEEYLNLFREIKTDKEDEIILILYEIIFYSKADENLKFNIQKYNSALFRMDRIFENLSEKHPFMPYYLHEKGIEHKVAFQTDSAVYYFKRAEKLTKGIKKYHNFFATNYWQLADTYIYGNQNKEAFKYLEKSRSEARSLKDTFFDNRLAANYYKNINQYKQAFDYLKSSIDNEYVLSSKNYSFMSNQLSSQFKEEAEVKYETAKKEKQILEEQQKVRANRNWLIAASIALIFGFGIAILLQKNTSKKRQLAEQETVLKQQRVDNLLKEQELLSIDAMIAGQEKERQKVAGELHDDLGSLMATIKLHFDNAKSTKKDPALKNAQKLLEEAYQKIRGMAHSKNSGVMSDQGLLAAITKMAKTITATNAIKVDVEDFGMGERLENSLELSIFRMVQELVANAIKHAEASKVSIQFTQHDDKLNIIIEDDGKGFNRSNLNKTTSGMGLTTIEKRVEHLEGSFTVDSILGKGTSILIDIPV